MTLVDRTNETVVLSMHKGKVSLDIEVDSDSSIHPEPWVWFMFDDDDEPWYKLTLDEARRVRDRLNLIVGDA